MLDLLLRNSSANAFSNVARTVDLQSESESHAINFECDRGSKQAFAVAPVLKHGYKTITPYCIYSLKKRLIIVTGFCFGDSIGLLLPFSCPLYACQTWKMFTFKAQVEPNDIDMRKKISRPLYSCKHIEEWKAIIFQGFHLFVLWEKV